MKNLSDINLNHLHCFWRIAGAGSISAAAKSLFRSQPALSLQMDQFERAIGKKLLERGHRGMELTPDGQRLFECCEQVFPVVARAVWELEGGKREDRTFRIAAGWTISHARIAAVMKFVRKALPGTSVRVTTGGRDYLAMRLNGGMADIALSDTDLSPKLGKDFVSKLASRANLYFLGTPKTKKKMGRFPDGLSAVPMIVRPPDNQVRRATEAFFHRNGIAPTIHSELSNHEIILRLVLDGEGAAAIDPVSAKKELRSGALVRLHPRPVGICEDIWFIHGRAHAANAAVQALMAAFRFPEEAGTR